MTWSYLFGMLSTGSLEMPNLGFLFPFTSNLIRFQHHRRPLRASRVAVVVDRRRPQDPDHQRRAAVAIDVEGRVDVEAEVAGGGEVVVGVGVRSFRYSRRRRLQHDEHRPRILPQLPPTAEK